MKKIKTLFFSLALAGSIFLGTPTTYAFHNNTTESAVETREQMRVLMEIIDRVLDNHVDGQTSQEVIDAAIDGVIKSLDKHSGYIPPENSEDMQVTLSGRFFGIGAEVDKHKETGYIEIVSPLEGSPAEAAGLLPGDLIKSVNGIEVKDITLMEAVKKIRGPKDTKAKLIIMRGEEELPITVVRAEVIFRVVRSRMLENDLGYVKLITFNQQSTKKIKEAFTKLKAELGKDKQFKGVIFDLRGNPGGLLDQAISVSNMFMTTGTILSTRGRNGVLQGSARADSRQIIPSDVPLIILIDKGSASAAEIVAGTLKDVGRAMIVGVTSYGKGSVQTLMTLFNGGTLRLTTAKYYTAGGTTPHDVGITPDVVVEIPEKYWEDIPVLERRTHIDPQLQEAIDILLKVSNAPDVDVPSPNCGGGNPC